jgi:hypothetical protein
VHRTVSRRVICHSHRHVMLRRAGLPLYPTCTATCIALDKNLANFQIMSDMTVQHVSVTRDAVDTRWHAADTTGKLTASFYEGTTPAGFAFRVPGVARHMVVPVFMLTPLIASVPDYVVFLVGAGALYAALNASSDDDQTGGGSVGVGDGGDAGPKEPDGPSRKRPHGPESNDGRKRGGGEVETPTVGLRVGTGKPDGRAGSASFRYPT